MTSASELFYSRRSRVSRTDPDLESDSSLGRSLHQDHHRRHHHLHHNRRDLDGVDSSRRSAHARRLCHRDSPSDRAPLWLDQGSTQFVSSNVMNTETSSSMSRPLRPSERLPGAVLLARARLRERLRGVSVDGYRQSNRASSRIHHREFMLGDDSTHVDAENQGTDSSMELSAPFIDLTSETERLEFFEEENKKPPGLTHEDLENLHVDVFSCTENGVRQKVLGAPCDCSICLETFVEGDALIHLTCGHRFHSWCLYPWVRTCGDCPYCRRGILLCSESHKQNIRSSPF